MPSRSMLRRLIVLSALACAQALPAPAQRRATPEALPKLPTVREQQETRERWLKARLDTLLLPMMRRHKVEMWIVTNEEFHPDPVVPYVAPPIPYQGRRDFLIFFDRGDRLERLAVVRYPEEPLKRFFEVLNPPGRETAAALRKIVEERRPRTIALNFGGARGVTGGLTYDARQFLAEALGPDYSARFVPAAPLIVEYMDTRLPEELEHYRTAVQVTDILTRRALSDEVITPGRSTVGDVRWWFLQQVNSLGLDVWFHPDIRVQRRGQVPGTAQQFLSVADEALVLERGDLLHIDCGINYLGLSTDWQKMAYILRPGERDAPEGLKRAMANTNRLQDALFKHIRAGAYGHEVYDATMADMKREGVEAMIYSHSVGNQGHALGAGIDFRRPSAGAPSEPPFREGSYTSIELNTTTPVPEWGGQKVTVMLEDDAYLTREGMRWFRPRQTSFYLIR